MTTSKAYQIASLLAGPIQCLEDQGIATETFWQCAPASEKIRELVEQRQENPLLRKVLKLADGPVKNSPEALQSPFAFLHRNEPHKQPTATYIFPEILQLAKPVLYPERKQPQNTTAQKKSLLEGFLTAWKQLCQDRGTKVWEVLLPLLERHFATYPSGVAGVAVYDHVRVAAARMACLFDQNPNEVPALPPSNQSLAILVKGDISGIQEFIFRVHSKGASKALKARSAEVLHLGELMVARYRQRLQLTQAQVLYIGGGNFYFLAPPSQEEEIMAELHRIRTDLLKRELRFHLGYTALQESDFQDIGPAWGRVEESLQAQRLKPMEGIPFATAFGTHPPPIKADNREYRDKADRYKDATGFQVQHREEDQASNPVHHRLGNSTSLTYKFQPDLSSLAYNNLNLEAGWGGFRFAGKRLPKWTPERLVDYLEWESTSLQPNHKHHSSSKDAEPLDRKPGNIIDFQALSGFAAMDKASRHLGILKMDVDNLGALFREGLPQHQRSLTRNAALSRTLKWFFAGYIETLVQEAPFHDLIYIIFSGGDDVFLAGPWHLIFAFAGKLRQEFARLVGGEKTLTLSGGMLLLEPSYPVNRFAIMGESALEGAKSGEKDKVTLFGESISWADYQQAAELKDELVTLINTEKAFRKILQTLRQSATGFERQSRSANQKLVRMPRIWRLHYMLRDSALGKNKDEKNKHASEIEHKIIRPYEKLIAMNFTRPSGQNHQPILFAVAARWAEFSIRNFK